MIGNDLASLVFPDVFIELKGVLPEVPVILKLEGFNVTGSIKIKTALYLVAEVEARGMAHRGATTLIESSSGNLGVALSFLCRRLGYHFLCVTDPNVSRICLGVMKAHGAEVLMVDEPDAQGGYLASRIRRIEQIIARDPSCVWLNQYAAAANSRAHYETTAMEILGAIPAPDYVFIGAGSGGTLVGCARRLREQCPGARVIAVDPAGSVSFGGRPGPRRIPGIGASVRPQLLSDVQCHAVVSVSERETIQMCHEIVRRTGLLVGGSTGTVLAAVRKFGDGISRGAKVVAISPDLGEKYLDTIYDPKWVVRHFGFSPTPGSA